MKSKKQKLRDEADKLYQATGLKILGGICLICGGKASCIHHYIPKSVSTALRYELRNGIPICVKCHCRLHSSPDPESNNIIRDKKGGKWLRDLRERRSKEIKADISFYQNAIIKLKKQLTKWTINSKSRGLDQWF